MCGDTIVPDPARTYDSGCQVPCKDASDEYCGGLKKLKRQVSRALAVYSLTIVGPATATSQASSALATSSASITRVISSSSRQSFSYYANATSSTATSSNALTTSGTTSLPYGCTDLACVSASNAGRDGLGAFTLSLPFGCDSKFPLPSFDFINGEG